MITTRNLIQMHNTPAVVHNSWMKHLWEMKANLTVDMPYPVLRFENKKLSNINGDFNVEGVLLHDENIFAIITSETHDVEIDNISGIMITTLDQFGVDLACEWNAIYTTIDHEKRLSTIGTILQYSTYPISGVGAIIAHKRKEGDELEILLGRRVKGPPSYLNRLSNFGGAIDLGETTSEALRRELLEEVNLDLSELPTQPFCFDETIEFWGEEGALYHAFSTTYAVMLNEDQLSTIKNMEPHKTRNFGWYKVSWLLENENDCTKLLYDSLKMFINQSDIVYPTSSFNLINNGYYRFNDSHVEDKIIVVKELTP